jgi:hypothetical protein
MTAGWPAIAVDTLLTFVIFAAYEKEIYLCIGVYFPVLFAFTG